MLLIVPVRDMLGESGAEDRYPHTHTHPHKHTRTHTLTRTLLYTHSNPLMHSQTHKRSALEGGSVDTGNTVQRDSFGTDPFIPKCSVFTNARDGK